MVLNEKSGYNKGHFAVCPSHDWRTQPLNWDTAAESNKISTVRIKKHALNEHQNYLSFAAAKKG